MPVDTRARRIRRAVRVLGVLVLAVTGLSVAFLLVPQVAYADVGQVILAEPASLEAVVTNIRNWLVGILVAVATLFLTIGGLRMLAANGDPGEVEKGKLALKSAALGYALALLAPLFVTIVGSWVK